MCGDSPQPARRRRSLEPGERPETTETSRRFDVVFRQADHLVEQSVLFAVVAVFLRHRLHGRGVH